MTGHSAGQACASRLDHHKIVGFVIELRLRYPHREELILKEVLRTNDPVLISYLQHVLNDAGIEVFVMDSHTSILEGSIGVLPRRLMVLEEDEAEAKRLIAEARSVRSSDG